MQIRFSWQKKNAILTCFFFWYSKIQSVFQLSDGSGVAVTVARYETPAHNDIDKVHTLSISSLSFWYIHATNKYGYWCVSSF